MFFCGCDFSALEETERLGGVFRRNGRAGDLVTLLREAGVNAARLRLWVDPYAPDGAPYGGGGNDLACLIRLARRAKAQGMRLLLDLQYSDFWCDPGRQLLPKAWRGLSLPALADRVACYTRDVLGALAREGLSPDWVQVGNEITNGMLWPHGRIGEPSDGGVRQGYDALSKLVGAGAQAVRECSGAQVVLHLEDSGNNARWREWFDEMFARGTPCDVIGASYYPFWHGGLDGLRANLADMSARYGKDVMIVETAYAFTTEPYAAGVETPLLIQNTARCPDGGEAPYPFTREGQRAFLRDLMALAHTLPGGRCKGLFYWEPGWLPLPGSTWATEAARAYMNEQGKPGGNEWANQCLFDYEGCANPALGEFVLA